MQEAISKDHALQKDKVLQSFTVLKLHNHLFSPLGKFANQAIYFTFRNFFVLFLTAEKLSQHPLDRFSQSLHQMINICLKMTDLDLIFIPQGTLPWQPIKVKNQCFFRPIYFVALPFRNGLQYRNFDFKRQNRTDFFTLCTILVTFDPETPEFTLLTIAPFAVIQQNRHIT